MTPTSKKRTIDDFFGRDRSAQVSPLPCSPILRRADPNSTTILPSKKTQLSRPSHSSSKSAGTPGLQLVPDFVTLAEEQQILGFFNDPTKCKWRTDLSRRTMHFGGTYCLFESQPRAAKVDPVATAAGSFVSHRLAEGVRPAKAKPEIIQAPPMPAELDWLLDRFEEKGVFHKGQRPQYCIVNEYTGSLGISAHVENFQFGEPVVGLSLLCPVSMRFHELVRAEDGSVRSGKASKCERTGKKEDVLLQGRSLCVMRGESRWKWQHEILRSNKGRGAAWKRVSLTFRWKDGEGR